MLIVLTVRREYHYEVEVSVELLDKKLQFRAELVETAMISHFDNHADYFGSNIEECLEKLAIAIDKALETLSAM